MQIVERLRGVPLFSGVDDFHLQRIADIAEERLVVPNAVLSRQAELGATFFVIDSGEAEVLHVDPQGFRRPVGMLHPGDSYGVTSLFLGEPRDATVEAKTTMRVWAIQRLAFQDLLLNYPGLRDELRIPETIRQKLRAPRYPWLQPGEVVVYHTKRHWVVFVSKMAPGTLLMLIYAVGLLWFLVARQASSTWVAILLLPALIVYLGYLGWQWVDWQNDYFAVSTQRVTHREQVAFIYESRHEAPLEQVQNTNVVLGPIGSLLGFGDLTITTAATRGQMLFTTIPNPFDMQTAINAQIDRVLAVRRAVQRRLIRQDLATHINVPLPETTEAPVVTGGLVIDPDAPVVVSQPRLARLMRWLTYTGFIPHTRIEENNTITWRKHWIFLARRLVLPSIVIVVAGLLTGLGLFGIPQQLVSSVPYYLAFPLITTLAAVAWFWWESTDWANDLYIVTPDRIIDIEKKPLFFSEQRREANLGVIQDVDSNIPDPVARLFDYGDVIVKTAGAGGDFTFEEVGNPRDVQREIFARMSQYKARQREEEEARRRREMAEWFSVYDELQRARGTNHVGPAPGQMPSQVTPGPGSAPNTDNL
jgi:membrane protein YdbS with pleckstrin-like domain